MQGSRVKDRRAGAPAARAAAVAALLCAALACACGGPVAPSAPRPAELTVFAAASLAEAFGEIGGEFGRIHGAKVTFNFAGSQQLAQQLGQGAPGDVFAPANQRQMDSAVQSGRVAAGAPRTFAKNRLVVVAPAGGTGRIDSLRDLARPGLKVVLAAREVPAGQYSLDMLDRAGTDPAFGVGFREAVLRNVVSYEQDVRAVLAKVRLGEADAGIVYSSDAASDLKNEVVRIEVPDSANVVASYPIAPVRDSASGELAARFIAYVLSPPAQRILAKYGFVPAAPAASDGSDAA
jgi:molybdate transport system substrate-binding protein